LKTHRPRQESSSVYYGDFDKISRGASNHSGGTRTTGQTLQKSDHSNHKKAVTCKARNDSGFQFKRGSSSKSQQKGYSALATKSVLSGQLKRDQQSGGALGGKLNSSVGAIGDKGKKRSNAVLTGQEK
jgi:hypothetical protein